ncbi:MAG: 50S ribosomal protein L22 [Fimbriimonadales bacterium]|nr:MAG: 50S ribosomal protein L22 [Fimbriimonadales bacterium]GIV09232.1 MAG: 50S ribosomal protein L22 [Fimbriimonadales bacterium]
MKAVARHVRIPPRKARLAIDLVRGKPVGEAMVILQRLPNKSARVAKKVLESAVANAVHNDGLSPNMLYIERAYVDEGPRWKRILPKDRGRAYRILKRTSHVTIELGIAVPKARPTVRKDRSTTAQQQEEQN